VLLNIPVLRILEDIFFLIEESRPASKKTGDDTTEDGDQESDQEDTHLDASLAGGSAVLAGLDSESLGISFVGRGHGGVDGGNSCSVFEALGEAGGRSTSDSTHDAGHAVEVVDATGVVNAEVVLQEGGDVNVSDDGEGTSDHANQHGAPRLDEEVSGGTDGDTTSESSVLDVDHVEFLTGAEDGGADEGHDAGAAESDDGVDAGAVLLVASGEGAVKGGPEHPEEDGTDHGEEVRVLGGGGGGLLVLDGLGDTFGGGVLVQARETPRDTETEVGAEGVDEHGTANVNSLQVDVADGEVEAVEGAAAEGDEHELLRSDLTKESSEGNHHGTSVEVGIDHLGDGKAELVEVTLDDFFPEVSVQESPLENERGDEEVEADGGEGVLGGEGHEETEADEDHDVDVLVHGVETIQVGLGGLLHRIIEGIVDEDAVEDEHEGLPGKSQGGESHGRPSHLFFIYLFF